MKAALAITQSMVSSLQLFPTVYCVLIAYHILELVWCQSGSDGCPSGNRCVMLIDCTPSERTSIVGRPNLCGFDSRLNVWMKICCPDIIQNQDCSNSPGVSKEEHILGEDAEQGAWPWMVAVMKTNKDGHSSPICSGYMISKRHLISAARCFKTNQIASYSARIGNVDITEGESYDVARIKIHEDFETGHFYNDIALLTLTKDVQIPDFTPVCLPAKSAGNLDGKRVTLIRWGVAKSNGTTSITLKQSGDIVEPEKECKDPSAETLSDFNGELPKGINQKFLCAVTIHQSLGNAGAPLMVLDNGRWYAIGIVAFQVMSLKGSPEGLISSFEPTRFTRVSEYVDWINRNKY